MEQLNLLELTSETKQQPTPAAPPPAGASSREGLRLTPAGPSLPPDISSLEKERDNAFKTAEKITRKINSLRRKTEIIEKKKKTIEWREDGSSNKEICSFVEEMKKVGLDYNYIQVQYLEGMDFDGEFHYVISVSQTEEIGNKGINPFTGKENTYGGFWGCAGADLTEKILLNRDMVMTFLKGILDKKKEYIKIPYLNPSDGHFFTSVKGPNFRIFFDNKVKEMFSGHGDIEKFIAYFNSLDNRSPAQEELDIVKEYYRLEKEIENLEKNEDIEKAVRCLFNLGSKYSCEKVEMPMSMTGKTPDKLCKLYEERERHLKETKAKFEEIKKKIYT